MSKIKLVPVPNITKRELMTALMDGRKFNSGSELKDATIIHWDDNFGDSPVRHGLCHWRFRGFKYLHEIIETNWYDNIPEEGVLCWVDDDYDYEKNEASLVFGYDKESKWKFDGDGDHWAYAKPVTAADLYQEQV